MVQGKASQIKPNRVPAAVDGIQINYCKNPSCQNFGIPALDSIKGKNVKDGYIAVGGTAGIPMLKCKLCGEFPPIKSNRAISEELTRLLADITQAPDPSCPDQQCANHNISVNSSKGYYQCYGNTHSGSKRFLCKACGKTFTVSQKSTLRQRQSDKNEWIFKLLMNKSPMRRICELVEIHPETLYQRIDFLYRQCKIFTAAYEHQLMDGKTIPRLYIAVDRQDYTINWSNQHDKRNVIMHSVGSADLHTGYVFGMHLDFDPSLDSAKVEADALVINDHALSYAFRRYARLWLKSDYNDYIRQRRRLSKRKGGISKNVTTDDLRCGSLVIIAFDQGSSQSLVVYPR